MKKLIFLTALVLAVPLFAQSARRAVPQDFASDFQTVPAMGNTTGFGGTRFVTYVALFNPTSSAFNVVASLYDANGTKREATIPLAANELKTYANFLETVFNYTGGGAVTFQAPATAGGTNNNRFIVSAEARTMGARYGTSIPTVEFAGSSSKSFAAGVAVTANSRTNVGCFNQSDATNAVKASVYDKVGGVLIGTVNLTLPPKAWGQTTVTSIVTDGYVQFEPAEPAVCYAVVVDNATNDGRFISAVEYTP